MMAVNEFTGERRGKLVVLPPDFLFVPRFVPRSEEVCSSLSREELVALELLQASLFDEDLAEIRRGANFAGSIPGPPPLPGSSHPQRAAVMRPPPPALAHVGKNLAMMGTAARKGLSSIADAFHSR